MSEAASSPHPSPHPSPERDDKEEPDMMQIYNALDQSVKYNIQRSMGIVIINDVTLPTKKIHVSGLTDRATYDRLVEQGILEDNKFDVPTFIEPTYKFLAAYDGPEEIRINVNTPTNVPKLYSGKLLEPGERDKPCNPRAWHDLYIKKSHPKQRKNVSWSNIVDAFELPKDWETMRFPQKCADA
jgi:hypothetical protein